MNQAYYSAFYDLVKETSVDTGYQLPDYLESYIVMLLAFYVERSHFLPESTFAECYLKLSPKNGESAKHLGDTCLFLTGVFPGYGKRFGMKKSYYQDIGSGSYMMAASTFNGELFFELANHFNYLSDFIEQTIHRNRLSAGFKSIP